MQYLGVIPKQFVPVKARRSMRWACAALVLALPALGACSVSTAQEGTSDTSASPASTASDRSTGVTDSTIRLGVAQLDLASIANLVDIDQGDVAAAYQGAIDEINADGGINGRMIEPYIVPVNPALPTSSAAACTKLTEDKKVFAVVGFFRNDDAICYLKTHDTPIVGYSLNATQRDGVTAPWFNTQLTDDHLIPRGFAALKDQGVFDGHKVAVVGLSTDADQLNKVVVPALDDLGVDVVQTAINDGSVNDLPAVYAQFKLIAQKFEAAGADIVIAVGGAGQAWPVGLQVNQSKYLPRLIATDFTTIGAYIDGSSDPYYPALKDAISLSTGLPAAQDVWTDPALQKCVASITAAHPSEPVTDPTTADPNGPTPWVSALNACQQVHLFAEIARAAGKNLTNATFDTGGESLDSVTLPGAGAPLHYGPGEHDGGGAVTIQNWDDASKTFVASPAG